MLLVYLFVPSVMSFINITKPKFVVDFWGPSDKLRTPEENRGCGNLYLQLVDKKQVKQLGACIGMSGGWGSLWDWAPVPEVN